MSERDTDSTPEEHAASGGADPWGERLPRRLGLLSAITVLIGTTIGSGIFRVPATVAGYLPDPTLIHLAWALGGIISLFGALTLAELAGALPRSGGIFTYILEGFGPLPAFLLGWSEMTMIRASALGAIATVFADYLSYFVPLTPQQVHYVAAAVIVTVAVINYIGVRRAATVMNLMTVVKYVALLGLALLAFTSSSGSASRLAGGGISTELNFSLLAMALIPIMWTYDGWANLSFVGGEVKNPQRTLPTALILGTLGIIAIYILTNIGFMYLIPLPEMARSNLIAATAAEHIPLIGHYGGAIIAALVMISTFSSVNGSMMTGPRIVFAMAERGLFFSGIARVSPRFQSPSVAIALAATLGVLYVLQNDFAQLTNKFILGIWPFYVLAVAAVFVLRRKRPDLPRPYRTWGYPVVPILFMVASIGVMANALWADPVNTGLTFAIILSGIPVYYAWNVLDRRRRSRRS